MQLTRTRVIHFSVAVGEHVTLVYSLVQIISQQTFLCCHLDPLVIWTKCRLCIKDQHGCLSQY